MNDTMGKRISAYRKQLGMTQDQLAEKLGVTPQAVSKWETGQSCPDISLLPRLAELFGATTDELLGRMPPSGEKPERREAEIVAGKKGMEFRWDGGKQSRIGLALWVLLTGGLLLCSNLCGLGAGLWELLWPSALLVFGLMGLAEFAGGRRRRISFLRLAVAVAGGYFLLDALGQLPGWVSRELLLPVLLLLLGLSLLLEAVCRPWKRSLRLHWNRDGQNSFDIGEDSFSCEMNFGESTPPIRLPVLRKGSAEVSFGEMTVDLRHCDAFAENAELDVSCSFGEMTVLVPGCCVLEHRRVSQSFGNLEVQGQPDPDARYLLKLKGAVSFGNIRVCYC